MHTSQGNEASCDRSLFYRTEALSGVPNLLKMGWIMVSMLWL